MRLRHKPYAQEKLLEYKHYVVEKPEKSKGKWTERFEKAQPLHIEIGCGKGRFIIEMAKRYPEINFIGIELQTSVIVSALEKQIDEELPNLQLMQVNAKDLREYFEAGEVDRIYLTFSDPWPKNRHEKRRLTYKSFLSVYETILNDKGELHFKTDNQKLFEYSLTSFSKYDAVLEKVYLDLHNSDVEDNVMTEYEEKFSKKGNRIYKAVVMFK
ncbi:tRNA (guanosine(46)-N7)-methyltransferase TrmB [Alkalibacterium thalassium]|uniref:tRNA (guanine-N(7)-)-methyltransferase n=1 Tax=Alkalibacterium thalassium TaxID=426701 RepID=A0A1G8WAM2_9LACT|nr:tRNA (guanosine(46)-N7)-methyltransferase TrmB [Alkalibacterium thalassium]SDJ75226.1 tRNA (guanine-N7-)-methyltransferase [Alkalibacterium thalassium]